jgi:hypothetical protein
MVLAVLDHEHMFDHSFHGNYSSPARVHTPNSAWHSIIMIAKQSKSWTVSNCLGRRLNLEDAHSGSLNIDKSGRHEKLHHAASIH